MTIKKAYTIAKKKKCMQFAISKLIIVFLFHLLIFNPSFCLSQEEPQYDEVTVYLKVPGIGGADISALIKNDKAYLSISDVFTLLKIKNTSSAHLDSLSGFFINPQDEYLIDRVKNNVIFQGKKIELKPDDLILTETNLYMKAGLFGELFGLNCLFILRNLSVELTTKLELPTIREMKTEQMRENLKRLRGEVKTDTTIGRSYPLFKFGMADWAINTSQQKGVAPTTQLNLSLGSVVAGGEMNVGISYDQANQFDSRQQTYLWRYVNNEHQALRQVLVGKMPMQTISTTNGQVVGLQLTNTPTLYRKSFGTYTLTNVTEPGWLVELYINNVLVDYVKADASGFYKFEVPLTYGNTVLKVRAYGPWGEVREKVENANVPFNFLPPGEMEYSTTVGVIEDQPDTKFSRTNINYGVNRHMTIGGGYEYFRSPMVENSLPFIGSSYAILKNLLFAGEYIFETRLKSSLSYRLPSNLQFDLNYTSYDKSQKAIPFSPILERGIAIAVPFQGKRFSIYSMLSLSQRFYDLYKTSNASFLFSGSLLGISSNVTTTIAYLDTKQTNFSSNISLSFRLPKRFILRPSAQYDYIQHKWANTRIQLDKPLFKNGYLNISYSKDFLNKMNNSINIGLRYDFSFMQTGVVSKLSKNVNSFSQSASGSLLFDRKSRYVGTSNTSTVGRGGFIFFAFLDMNGNGKRDKNEPKVAGLNLRVNGGRIVKRDKDSTIRVVDLTPYTSYLVELNNNSFQNIAWKVKKSVLSVYADPNQFRTIEIPVDVMSEAAGTVNLKTKNGSRGLGRVYVCFYRNGQMLAGKVLTEGDGYYSYMGLKPGEYVARLDSSQLTKIKMSSFPEFKTFTIKESKDGDFVESLDFTLQSNAKDTIENVLPKAEPKAVPSEGKIINYASADNKKTNAFAITVKQTQRYENNLPGVRYSQSFSSKDKLKGKNVADSLVNLKALRASDKSDSSIILSMDRNHQIADADGQRYSIQFGTYISEKDALSVQRKITIATGLPVIIVSENGLYVLWIEGFSSRREANQLLASLSRTGFQENVSQNIISPDNVSADTTTGSKNIPVYVKAAKIIKYGPWQIQNQLVVFADSIANIFKFEPKGSKTRGFPIRAKQDGISIMASNTVVKPLQLSRPSSIIELNRNAKITVVKGQQYSIQVGQYIFDKSATSALKKIAANTNLPVIVVIKNGFYNLLIEGFQSRKDAKLFIDQLAKMGFQGTIIKVNS